MMRVEGKRLSLQPPTGRPEKSGKDDGALAGSADHQGVAARVEPFAYADPDDFTLD